LPGLKLIRAVELMFIEQEERLKDEEDDPPIHIS
jgi:hypothetical protein